MIKKINTLLIPLCLIMSITTVNAVSKNNVPEKKWTKADLYLNAKEAYAELKQNSEKIMFIDVRTKGEIAYTGMPTAADTNIPFKFTSKQYQWDDKRNSFKMTPNPDFVAAVTERLLLKGLSKNDKVFVMCRSGGRSAKAADVLTNAGFTQVFSIVDGFEGDTVQSGKQKGNRSINGWKNSQLPWSFKLDKNKMYLVSKGTEKDKKHKMLKKMDIDNNNHISQNEFDDFHKNMFQKIDQNKNSILEMYELNQFKALKKQLKQEKKMVE